MTFSSVAKVTEDHALAVAVPTTLDQGEYPVLVVLQESPSAPRRALTFSNHQIGATAQDTFRREDFYGDDDR